MGNETDQAGLIKRKRIYSRFDFAVDVDGQGRFFFYVPDGAQELGLDVHGVCQVHDAVEAAMQFWQKVGQGTEVLPK